MPSKRADVLQRGAAVEETPGAAVRVRVASRAMFPSDPLGGAVAAGGEVGVPADSAAYLCYSAAPCDVAIAASAVRRVLPEADAEGVRAIDLELPIGVSFSGAEQERGRRVLLLEGLPLDCGLLVPQGGALVNAVDCELMQMPALFRYHPYTGVLAHAAGLALVLDLEAIGKLSTAAQHPDE